MNSYPRMRVVLSLCAAVFAAAPATADPLCDALWFTRNLIFDRAGYCFSSPLGQANFSAECSTSSPEISGADKLVVDLARQEEEMWECNVDTSRTTLEAWDTQVLAFIEDLPVPTGYESACLGWRGEMLMLRAARDPAADTTGFIRAGNDILLSFHEVAGWTFVSMTRDGQGLGWLQMPPWTEGACDGYAG